ncbi:hypothetical protein Droror1_Dr00001530 [Drosera rotundifolia]
MEGNYGYKNDNAALLKLLGDNLLLNNSPRSNSSGSCHFSPSDNSPLMRYLLWGNFASGSPIPMSRQFYNSNGSGGSSSGSGGISSRRSSPFSAMENKERLPLSAQLSPEMKIEEDVLVMDGVLVEPVKHGASRLRSSVTSTDSGGSYSSAFPSPGSFYKTEMCRPWEVLGACQFGLKCQFAHGKEELRPIHLPNKNLAELSTGKSYSSLELSIHGPRHRFAQKGSTAGPPREALGATVVLTSATPPHVEPKHNEGLVTAVKPSTPSPAVPEHTVATMPSTPSPVTPERTVAMMPNTPSPVTPEYAVATMSPVLTISCEWFPLDDGIEVELINSSGNPPSRKAVDYINNVLYGPTGKTRLPVFADICPE